VKNSFYTKANLLPRLRTTNQWLQNEIEAVVRRWSWNSNWKMLCLWRLCRRGSTMVQTRRLWNLGAYGIFASRWPSFLKFFLLIKFYIGFFLLMRFYFSL
jgi:hypothetical protein